MEYQENTRRRARALDGTSFRFERKGKDLYVNGMPAHTSALAVIYQLKNTVFQITCHAAKRFQPIGFLA